MTVSLSEFKPLPEPVIIVEDEPLIRILLEETLEEIGISSTTFDNAGSALIHLKSIDGKCSLIIADHGLPGGIQGIEFIRLAHERWPSIPSILTSGYSIDKQELLPATVFLPKPYTLVELEETITNALRQRHSPPQQ
ncbi:response regulator [Pseudomonas fluorescens]|uniref:response regulator n=1 Tax=Pseudomonas fluorescens TaxID=294 RepID=UPI00178473C6|nr:response regulator [Pseudomonas fluorescens]